MKFDECYDGEDFPLKPEFYYAFDEDLKSDVEYSNYLRIVENDENVLLSLFYNNELYTKEFIDLFLSSLAKIINLMIDSDIDETDICDIALVNENEITFAEVELPLIHKRFERQAIEKGDEVALVACDATLTYNQLNEKANIIANSLIEKGIEPKSNILIKLSRNSNLIASILAILKAGCAFIPIDPDYPQERINHIYENSQADYIISEESIILKKGLITFMKTVRRIISSLKNLEKTHWTLTICLKGTILIILMLMSALMIWPM